MTEYVVTFRTPDSLATLSLLKRLLARSCFKDVQITTSTKEN
jgi:hypothetical protein